MGVVFVLRILRVTEFSKVRKWISLKQGTGNGGTGNGERGTGNGESLKKRISKMGNL